MKAFWDNIIRPIIENIDPKHMVEIGSEKGINTKNILDYCEDHNTHMTAIDPSPLFDVNKFKNKYGNKFEIYKGLSLSILPLLKDYEVILIDGDHNWYTVYNELKIIEKSFKGKQFPLVFLHDVGWPYGRRDLYYNPDNIPEHFRQPYKQLGIYPGEDLLKESGGLNPHLYNSIYENNPNNGVLTALENFVDESDLEFYLEIVDAYNGLGILFPKDPELKSIVKNTIKKANLVSKLELERLRMVIKHSEARNQNESLGKALNENKIKFKNAENALEQVKSVLEEKGNELDGVYHELEGERAVIKEMEGVLEEKGNELHEAHHQLQEKQRNLEIAENQFKELSRQIDNLTIRFLEMGYLSNNGRPIIQRLISKFPSLYILFNRKNNSIKNALINIKGYRAIKKNNLLNIGFYLKNNGDVRLSGMDPILHYIYHGFKEGRKPNPNFDTDYYLKVHDDVNNAKLNPLVHYSLYGFKEERKTSGKPHKMSISGNPKVIREKSSIIAKQEKNSHHQKFLAELENKFKVSIIMPTYNREYIIKRAINSILNQTFSNYELIICDDGSTDDTEELLKKDYAPYFKSGKFIYLKKEHVGVSNARNTCLERSHGDLIAYLDTDNHWEPEYLEKMVTLFMNNPEDDSAYSALHHHNLDKGTNTVLNKQFDREKILKRNQIDLNTFMHRRTLYELLGGFNESLTRLVDWDIILRYTKDKNPLFLNEILVQYYISENFDNITLNGSYIEHRKKIYNIHSDEIINRAISESNCIIDPFITLLYLESKNPIHSNLKVGVLVDDDLESLKSNSYTRLYSPLKDLSSKEVFKIFFYANNDFSKVNINKIMKCKLFDAIIIQKGAIDIETSKLILKKCKDNDIKVIYDLDDDSLSAGNADGNYPFLKNIITADDYLIKNSDLITVPNNELLKHFSGMHKTSIVPNCLINELKPINNVNTKKNINPIDTLSCDPDYLLESVAEKWGSILHDITQTRKLKDFKISIILPIYNMEKYLRKTLESIEMQTIGLENLEVLMINEASSDGSKLIINEYANKYENFVAVHLSESSGTPGKPRNIGMGMARGEYIMFIDHDDFYSDDACEVLYNKISKEGVDIVSGIYNFVRGNDIRKLNDRTNILLKIFENQKEIKVKNIAEKEELLSSPPVVWSKIFRRSFITDNSLRFPVGTLAEDLIFLSTALLKANGIIFLDHVVYNYRILSKGGETSISHKSDKKWFKGVIDARKIIYDTYQEEGKEKYFKQICQYSLNYLLDVFTRSNMEFDDKYEVLEYMHWLIEKSNDYGISPPEEYINLFNSIIKQDYKDAIMISQTIHG